jgi:hypothetical protein
MSTQCSKNGEPINHEATAKLYGKLSRLHLEMARVYAELASQEPAVRTGEKVLPIKSKSGKLLANLQLTDRAAKAEVVNPLPTDNAPYAWLKNHLKAMTEKDQTFVFRFGEQGRLLNFIEMEGKITPDLTKSLESALKWALSRMDSDQSTNESKASCKGKPAQAQGRALMVKEEGEPGG